MTGPRALAAAIVLSFVAAGTAAAPLAIESEPVAFHPEDGTIERTGALTFHGGLALRSPDARFGGLSGLVVSPDGRWLTFVTDVGDWVRARPGHDASGRLTGLGGAEIGRLLRPDGRPVAPGDKRGADAEGLTRIAGGLAVSFERDHRLWVYHGAGNPFLALPRLLAPPVNIRNAPPNRGMEALAALADGRLVAIAENFPRDAAVTTGWLREHDRWWTFDYRRVGLFHPTGAATLPGGDLLVLERRFTYVTGVASRLARVPAVALRAGATVEGRELARIEPPLTVDNFEGMDVRRDAQGRTLVYLVSDDNFNAVQRTLLFLFVLTD